MSEPNLIHYATLIRLQATVSALQNLLQAMPHPNDCREMRAEDRADFVAARRSAYDALDVAFGQRNDVPPSLTDRWADAGMIRAAADLSRFV